MAGSFKHVSVRIVKFTWRALLFVVVFALVLAGGGALWNALAIRQAEVASGIPGKMYDVDGLKMHIYCTGSGSPTIVLESGLGDDSMIWGKTQPELSKLTRVCAYDRAGFGWSEPRDGVRDSNAITHELYGLVSQAAIAKPFILMGHSIAGIHMRAYAALHPADIAGIVFIDGSTPRQDLHFPPEIERETNKILLQSEFVNIASAIGILRAMGQCDQVQPGFESYAAWIKADSCHSSQFTSFKRELAAVPASGDETLHTGPFGNMPILILSQDPSHPMAGLPTSLGAVMSADWDGMQDDLKKLSTHSRRIIANGSTHYIQVDRAELVNLEVAKFIDEIRTGTSSAQNGTTIRE